MGGHGYSAKEKPQSEPDVDPVLPNQQKNPPKQALARQEEAQSFLSDYEKDKREDESHANEKRLYELSVISMRVKFAWAIFSLVVVWLGLILFIVVSIGIGKLNTSFIFAIVGVATCSLSGGAFCYGFRMKKAESLHKEWISGGDVTVKHEYNRKRKTTPHCAIIWSGLIGILSSIFFVVLHTTCIRHYLISEPFHIEPSVMIYLITSTTASVLGILMAVMAWLFPRQRNATK